MGFPGGTIGKESTCQHRRCWFDPCIGKIPWRREWQPTSVFLPGESHGQRSLAGHSPQNHKELDTTEVSTHILYRHTVHLMTKSGGKCITAKASLFLKG